MADVPAVHSEHLQQAMDYDNSDGRRWIYGGEATSYDDPSHRAEFWALEGSPPRGFIIATPQWAARLDQRRRHRKTFTIFNSQ